MSNVSISSIEDRTIELACYIIENKATIRTAADCIGISKRWTCNYKCRLFS